MSWDVTRQGLRRLVFSRTVVDVAREIPCSRSHLYKIINGKIANPSQAVRAGVERVVRENQEEVRSD